MTKLADMSQQPPVSDDNNSCVRQTHTRAHTRTPDRLTRLAVRKTSIPASAAAEIPSCWLVNKAGTAFLVVNKKFQSIQSKKRERGEGGGAVKRNKQMTQ